MVGEGANSVADFTPDWATKQGRRVWEYRNWGGGVRRKVRGQERARGKGREVVGGQGKEDRERGKKVRGKDRVRGREVGKGPKRKREGRVKVRWKGEYRTPTG